MDLEWSLKGGRDREQKMREERLEVSESLVEEMDGFGRKKYGRRLQEGEMG